MRLAALLCAVAFLLPLPVRAASELVIAIRYLQAEGVSHSHLYLYREDGKLLRQLTTDNSGQERDPVFAPDGETIAFTREVKEEEQIWSVQPRGTGLQRLASAPEWYARRESSPYFTSPPEGQSVNLPTEGEPPAEPQRHRLPDGSIELVLKQVATDEDDQTTMAGHGKHYLFRDLKKGTDTEFAKIPGFVGTLNVLRLKSDASLWALLEGDLRVAFFDLHLDSTMGDQCFVLNLSHPRLIPLGPNWCAPIPLPGDPAFLTINFERYVPIPKSPKTANCAFIERWDAGLKKIRFATPGSAAIAYGFSMYRPGKSPAVITILKP